MNAMFSEPQLDEATALVGSVLRKGVKLWVEGGRLHFRGPRGALSATELQQLRTLSNKIVRILQLGDAGGSRMPELRPREQGKRIPLAYSQLKYWRSDRLSYRPTLRSVATATRISGPLDVRILQRSVAELIRRHEALRTRVILVDDVPEQMVDEPGANGLEIVDLRGFDGAELDTQIERHAQQAIVEPVHIATGPLFVARLLKVRAEEHVLVLGLEHIISDGYSLTVVMRELFAIYLEDGSIRALQPLIVQQADYAVWQNDAHEAWLERHGAYWNERFGSAPRLSLPSTERSSGPVRWGKLPFALDASTKTALIEWSRRQKTTVVLTALTAFAALVLKRYGVSDAVLRYQTDGRFTPAIENSIGYFAAAMSLRVGLRDDDTFLDLLETITQEYCAAVEHADYSYFDAQDPPPAWTRNPGFNWVPHALGGHPTIDTARGPLSFSPVPISITYPEVAEDYDMDFEPSIVMIEYEKEVSGTVIYSPRTVSHAAMEKFARDFAFILQELLHRPDQRVSSLALPG